MRQLKNFKIVILVIVVLLILVIVRNSDQNLFKKDAKIVIEAVQNNSNLITINQIQKLKNPYLVIDLGSESISDSIQFQHSVKIPVENILDKANRKILDKANGTLLLFSNDIATSSKVYVILNQLGYKNVLIITSEENPEKLKYKFQPDTTARLEQDSI